MVKQPEVKIGAHTPEVVDPNPTPATKNNRRARRALTFLLINKGEIYGFQFIVQTDALKASIGYT